MEHEKLKTMKEAELREYKVPFPKSFEELKEIIDNLAEREHDYGTCVYAMSISAEASFKYISSKLGCTGFQAGCADMAFIGNTRNMKSGFSIIDWDNALYPQFREKLDVSLEGLLKGNAEHFNKKSKELLADKKSNAVKTVKDHWKYVADYTDKIIASKVEE